MRLTVLFVSMCLVAVVGCSSSNDQAQPVQNKIKQSNFPGLQTPVVAIRNEIWNCTGYSTTLTKQDDSSVYLKEQNTSSYSKTITVHEDGTEERSVSGDATYKYCYDYAMDGDDCRNADHFSQSISTKSNSVLKFSVSDGIKTSIAEAEAATKVTSSDFNTGELNVWKNSFSNMIKLEKIVGDDLYELETTYNGVKTSSGGALKSTLKSNSPNLQTFTTVAVKPYMNENGERVLAERTKCAVEVKEIPVN